MTRIALTLLVVFSSLGCAALESTRVDPDRDPAPIAGPAISGQPYYLPGSVVEVDLEIAKKDDAAKACEAEAQKAAETACGGENDSTKKAACIAKQKKTHLDECMKKVAAQPSEHAVRLAIQPKITPDTGRLYVLSHKRNWLADDDLKIEVDGDGFLRSVSGKTIDRTGDAIETLASIAINVITGVGGIGPRREGEPSLVGLEGRYHWVRTLGEIGDGIALPIPGTADATVSLHAVPIGAPRKRGAAPSGKGVLVVVPQPYRLEAALKLGDQTRSFAELYAALPDGAPTFEIPVERTAFATVEHEIKVTQGMLTSVRIDRPSPVVEFLQVPLHLSQRLVDLPAGILKLRYDGPAQNAETKQQLEAAKQSIDQSRAALESVKNAAAAPPAN